MQRPFIFMDVVYLYEEIKEGNFGCSLPLHVRRDLCLPVGRGRENLSVWLLVL